jgi:tetratricopeptide (TPR) repeat protein
MHQPSRAHALSYVVGDLDAAATFVERALVLNPNLVGAWYASGWGRINRGEPEVAIKHLAHAMRLSPLDPQIMAMQAGTALAHFLAGRYDEASCWTEKAMWAQSNYFTTVPIAAASYALAGRDAEARKAMARARELEDLERLGDGLQKAGVSLDLMPRSTVWLLNVHYRERRCRREKRRSLQ